MADISKVESLDTRAAQVSQILFRAGVPNVLWGNYLLSIYGVPTTVEDIAYVVPDVKLAVACSALEKAEFSLCIGDSSCLQELYRVQPRPAADHYHSRDNLVISLYKKSDTLWELDSLGRDQLAHSPDIQSAAAPTLPPAVPGRGRGRLAPECSIVKIPSAARFCEVLILLHCRDYQTSIYRNYWMAHLSYMFEYVAETDALNGEDLREGFKEFYYARVRHEVTLLSSLLGDIRRNLSLSGRLEVDSVNN